MVVLRDGGYRISHQIVQSGGQGTTSTVSPLYRPHLMTQVPLYSDSQLRVSYEIPDTCVTALAPFTVTSPRPGA